MHAAIAVASIIASHDPTYRYDYNVVVIEGGSQPRVEGLARFTETLDTIRSRIPGATAPAVIRHIADPTNPGFAGGFNRAVSEFAGPGTAYIVQLNEDMFFAPGAILAMIDRIDTLGENSGLVCANLINGGLYDRTEPKPEDYFDFCDRHKSLPQAEFTFGVSNPPWAMTLETWKRLSEFDVFTPPLASNRYPGAMDESIDPFKVGWFADWDLFNRVLLAGYNIGMEARAIAYHYDHPSGSVLDASTPGWTEIARSNFIAKYGSAEDKYRVEHLIGGLGVKFPFPAPAGYPKLRSL